MIPSSTRALVARRSAVSGTGRSVAISRRALSHRRLPTAAASSSLLAGVAGPFVVGRPLFYSTERVLQLRSGKSKDEQPRVLYDPQHERENCGVGLIASLKSEASRDIVVKADEMLVRMAHRGGCGCDPASGDGSGT